MHLVQWFFATYKMKKKTATTSSRVLLSFRVQYLAANYILYPFRVLVLLINYSSFPFRVTALPPSSGFFNNLKLFRPLVPPLFRSAFQPPPLLQPKLVYTNRSLDALLLLLLCLPACSCKLLHCGVPGCRDCSSAVVLEMHACVGRDQHFCCLLSPLRHQHVCAFINQGISISLAIELHVFLVQYYVGCCLVTCINWEAPIIAGTAQFFSAVTVNVEYSSEEEASSTVTGFGWALNTVRLELTLGTVALDEILHLLYIYKASKCHVNNTPLIYIPT